MRSLPSGTLPVRIYLAFGMFLIVVMAAILPPVITNTHEGATDVTAVLRPPVWTGGSADHIFGTDGVGRDVFTQMVYGARTSLFIAVVSSLISMIVGTTLGILAGYFGGWLDSVISRLVDVQVALPLVIIGLALVVSIGPSKFAVIIAVCSATWLQFARVIRGEVVSFRNSNVIQLSIISALSPWRIITRHILQRVRSSMIVLWSLAFGQSIVYEGSLSFLGLGVQPPEASWGFSISDSREYLATNPWTVLAPAVLLAVTALSVNVIGDFLRERFDPSLVEG